REVLQKRDLLVGKGAGFLPVHRYEPENGVVLDKGHNERGAGTTEVHQSAAPGIAGPVSILGLQIGDMDDAFPCEDTSGERPWPIAVRVLRSELGVGSWDAPGCDRLE